MPNLYMFEIRMANDDLMSLVVPGERNAAFYTAIILSDSKSVKEFKVSFGARTVLDEHSFGFGKIDKWVTEFDWKK